MNVLVDIQVDSLLWFNGEIKVTEYCYAKNVKQCIVSPGNER